LASGGLPFALANADLRMGLDAVAQVARRAGLTVRLRAEFGDRSVDGWSDAAVATYFCCAESVQNALKYASASTILIEVRADESIIRFRVVDDGRGVDSASDALLGGIRGLDDRVAALGGQIMVESAQGQGTIVRGVIPLGAGDEPATVAPTSSRTGATGLV
jgi:signal transduction histidine kinase